MGWTSGGVWQGVQGGLGGGGSSWKLLLNVDYSALANQNLKTGGDGTKTIGGLDYTIAGTASATTFEVLNGSGIRIVSTAGFPQVFLPVLNVLPDYTERKYLFRCFWQVGSGWDFTGANQRLYFSGPLETPAGQAQAQCAQQYDGTNIQIRPNSNVANQSATIAAGTATPRSAMVLEHYGAELMARIGNLTWTSPPAPEDVAAVVQGTATAETATVVASAAGAAIFTPANTVFTVMQVEGAFTSILKRFAVEYLEVPA